MRTGGAKDDRLGHRDRNEGDTRRYFSSRKGNTPEYTFTGGSAVVTIRARARSTVVASVELTPYCSTAATSF